MVRVRSFVSVVSLAACAALMLAGAAPADAACYTAWSCSTAYSVGAQVSYNSVNYTLTAGARGATCPGFTPDVDNWWTNNGACSGGSTPTATATTGATATATATAAPSGTATATRTSTATATATQSGGGGYYQAMYWTQNNDPCTNSLPGGGGEEWMPITSCSGCSAWASGTAYNGGGQVSRSCGGATPTATATGAATPTATATNTATPTTGTGIETIVTSANFDAIWPPASRAATYTYGDFKTAANSYYPGLCGTGDTNTRKRECAAYFGNKDQETGTGQYDKELYCQPGGGGYGTQPCDYCSGSTPCGACASGQKYWGRHAIQLSWDFNYCAGQTQIPVSGLHADPNQIFSNKVTGWKAADWYWMTQLGPAVSNGYGTWPMETAHDAITGTDGSGNYGYGGTIRAINGAIECGSRVQQQINRVTFYNGSGGDEEDSSGGTLGVLGYTGGAFGRRFCSP